MSDYQRLKPRNFTGLLDEEWQQFAEVVKEFLGSGKRSMFISVIIKKVLDNRKWWFEKEATLEQKSMHAIGDSFKFFGINVPLKKNKDKP